MTKHTDGVDLYYAKDAATWRKWLEKNHAKSKTVWLILLRLQRKMVHGTH